MDKITELLLNSKFIGGIVVGALALIVVKKLFSGGKKPKGNSASTTASASETSTSGKAEPAEKQIPKDAVIRPDEYRKFKLIEKKELTTGVLCPVTLYRFEIPDKSKSLGLPVGQHIRLRTVIEGQEILRSYTPTSTNNDKGFFDLVIKVYPKGAMSQFVDKLKIGESIEVCGPKGLFTYQKNKYKKIGMVAGGTGITPMLQVITEILSHPDDKTQVSLLFGNLTEQDIILREKIDGLAAKHKNFSAYHVLNEPPSGWTQGKGFITAEMMKERFGGPSDDSIVLLCGPPPMIKAMKTHLEALGYNTKQHIFTF